MVTSEKIFLSDSVISYDLKHRATLRHNISKYDESVSRGKNRYIRYNEAREYASDSKEAALAKLADHLELFEIRASERGIKVLWTGDAADAMHKSKEDVVALFHGKFGTDKNASPAELTVFVRKKLHSQFAAAGVGVTGANFLVTDVGGVSLSSRKRLDFVKERIKRRLLKLAGSPLGEQKELPPVALHSFIQQILEK